MKSSLFTLLLATVRPAASHIESFNLPGYGFSWYDPSCAFACYNALAGAPLECTSEDHSGGHSHGSGPTSPECRANDEPFLTTLASCMKDHCDDAGIEIWRRERFWHDHVTGDDQVLPRWSYAEALALIDEPPKIEFNSSEVLNRTALLPMASYSMQNNFNVMFDYLEALQPTYIFVILSISAGLPVLCSLLRKTPIISRAIDSVRPYLWRSIIGSYHTRPLPYLLGNAPNIGQALWLAVFIILNVVLSSVNYRRSQPHPWYFPPKEELLAYIGYRTGHISYALLPLTILFSSRNNFLLWITNWSYDTYMLLHKWVARMFTLQAIIHSITLLICYQGTGSAAVDSKKPYWLWGIVGTVLACAMMVFSHLYFRRLSYEIFVILHVVMAVFVIVGCWYHVILKWGYNFYDVWLMAASAIWFFDRLMRGLRLANNGFINSVVTEVDAEHVRVDIPGIRFPGNPGYVGYVYLPSLSPWRPWENHPFSVNSSSIFYDDSAIFRSRRSSHKIGSDSEAGATEKLAPGSSVAIEPRRDDDSAETDKSSSAMTRDTFPGTDGVTLIIKKSKGLTKLLQSQTRVRTLLEGPYHYHPASDILTCDRILLIGGGIGITGLLAWIHVHPNVKLAWSVRQASEGLAREVAPSLSSLSTADRDVRIGQRLDIDALLQQESQGHWKKVGVVVCGPAAMCDAVRDKVSKAAIAGAGGTQFELEVEAFSW